VTGQLVLVSVLTIAACSDREPREAPPRELPLETRIARELTAKLGVPVTTRCAVVGGTPIACHAVLADGTPLPIAIAAGSWQIPGHVIATAPIQSYVQGVLHDLGVAQQATCGPAVRRLAPGERIACSLSGGGEAFVEIARDGALAVELDLDPAAAAARTHGESDAELVRRSRALDREGDADEASP
jgi:hypothetical protein